MDNLEDKDEEKEKTSKRTIKDSVFGDMFANEENRKYLVQLYKTLHPADSNVTEADINNVTIRNVMVNDIYNDLGFIVRGKMIILCEAQSTWSPNIVYRLLSYLVDSYSNYIYDNGLNVYGSKAIELPAPELYVIYTGDKVVPDTISMKEANFPSSDWKFDIEAKVIRNQDKSNIIGQYIIFCKVFHGDICSR